MSDTVSAERIEKLESKIDSMWDKVMEMVSDIAVIKTKVETMTRDTNDIKRDVDEIKSTPKNRWNTVINTIIGLLATGFVAYLIAQANSPVAK